MIVADLNLMVYLFVPGPSTAAAEQVLVRDPVWIAPPIYRYELLNVMATHVRRGELTLDQATRVVDEIAQTVQTAADPERRPVLELSISTRVATYDCEYVVLARSLGIRVVTADREMLSAFPDSAIGIAEFAAGR